ncbi:MAG: transcription-repair coupling factor (superfamily II helicase) [Puniceicoccaceae bacterium 5H]|nr:MAG: transcription-repair coupling factor (superfamily II helicase) [Puniceicoccaceae bacterium 5H]
MKRVRLPDTLPQMRFLGVAHEAAPWVTELWRQEQACPVTIIQVKNGAEAERWAALLETLQGLAFSAQRRSEIWLLPPPPDVDTEQARNAESQLDRMAVFTRLQELKQGSDSRPLVVLTTPPALIAAAPPMQEMQQNSIRLKVGEERSFRDLQRQLSEDLDYDFEPVCEHPGQFAIRGGLIDVYPLNETHPLRIDFFGDEIDSIRSFDPTTQRTIDTQPEVVIAPRTQQPLADQEGSSTLFDYLPDCVSWVFAEPDRLLDAHTGAFETFENLKNPKPHVGWIWEQRPEGRDAFLGITEFDEIEHVLSLESPRKAFRATGLEPFRQHALDASVGQERVQAEKESRDKFLRQLRDWQQAGEVVWLLAPTDADQKRWEEIIAETSGLEGFKPVYQRGDIARGFRWELQAQDQPLTEQLPSLQKRRGWTVVGASDLFSRRQAPPRRHKQRKLLQRRPIDQMLDFSELADGDALVHLAHGICLYRGLRKMELKGREEEVISVEFADKLTLHLPLQESHLLTRYVGLTKTVPKLARLGSNTWEKNRRAAEKATVDFAAQLIQLQAQREQGEGFAFLPDSEWQREFEGSFPHHETNDQLRSIEDAKHDMERPHPMDRLLCGDVGFGKTEVAMRAAFKAVMSGKQVAVLVPTTILAQQHYNTFRERMADFPVTVEMISRFRQKKQQDKILSEVAGGQIDILIGTHRLLTGDVTFKDLGLLVIDEEHRFGVRHKEKLKQFKTEVDVFAMSATPIPRTLYLALMGVRDLSVIETPPADRLPVQTIVKGYDLNLVKKAISEELERGGQVFYLHNRVQTIESVAKKIEELVPQAKVGVGHGQMAEATLEKVMTRFVAGEYDVLVCTTIIENGLDIPNCNTMIIEGADRFGLSQLYQLRGRVGRYHRQAYAYLLLHRHAHMLDVARKRLTAMRQYTQLGAGFKIAMRDLELRGAGNLLGSQQSGHIANVGFELYCQLLRQSIGRLRGESVARQIRASVNLDFVRQGTGGVEGRTLKPVDVLDDEENANGRQQEVVEAYLPAEYVNEARLRIDLYRRLALAVEPSEVDAIEAELKDRFGDLPEPANFLVLVTRLRTLAEAYGFASVETAGDRLKLLRASGKRDDFVKVGPRFPRLTRPDPLLRLREIEQYLKRVGQN